MWAPTAKAPKSVGTPGFHGPAAAVMGSRAARPVRSAPPIWVNRPRTRIELFPVARAAIACVVPPGATGAGFQLVRAPVVPWTEAIAARGTPPTLENTPPK